MLSRRPTRSAGAVLAWKAPSPMVAVDPRPKVWLARRLISEHAFDKLRLIDC